MEYLTVGTNDIKRDLFVPVKDNEEPNLKPAGGMWFTRHNPKYEHYNEWVDYLVENPNVFVYKRYCTNLWVQPCSIIKLNDDSKIFTLEDTSGFEYLMNRFKRGNNYFSYEQMTHDYDGIFIDVGKMVRGNKYEKQFTLARQLCVSSLIIFNLDCIEYYYPGHILITPYDFEYAAYEGTTYTITHEKTKKRIK